MTDTKNVYQRLLEVQHEIKTPRDVAGRFGKARSAEQILEAIKPVAYKHGLYLYTSDTPTMNGDRHGLIASATVVNVDTPQEQITADAWAWENEVSAGLDTSQVSGKTSSYAKKYALQNLFAIDDTKDADQEHTDPDYPKLSAKEKADSRADVWNSYKLGQAKTEINDMLTAKGYDTDVAKLAFVKAVIEKEVIETEVDANLVADAIENEKVDAR